MSPPSPLPSPPTSPTNDFWYISAKHGMNGLYKKEGPFTSDKGDYYILTPVNKDNDKSVLELTQAQLDNVKIIDTNPNTNSVINVLSRGGTRRKSSRKNPKKKTRRNRRKSVRRR